jgi:hypothetical protein
MTDLNQTLSTIAHDAASPFAVVHGEPETIERFDTEREALARVAELDDASAAEARQLVDGIDPAVAATVAPVKHYAIDTSTRELVTHEAGVPSEGGTRRGTVPATTAAVTGLGAVTTTTTPEARAAAANGVQTSAAAGTPWHPDEVDGRRLDQTAGSTREMTSGEKAEARFFSAATSGPPAPEQKAAATELQQALLEYAEAIYRLVPSGPCRATALTQLQGAGMWAVRGIFDDGRSKLS